MLLDIYGRLDSFKLHQNVTQSCKVKLSLFSTNPVRSSEELRGGPMSFFHNVCTRLFPATSDVVVCQPINLLKRIETGLWTCYSSSKCIRELSFHPATPRHISYTREATKKSTNHNHGPLFADSHCISCASSSRWVATLLGVFSWVTSLF